MDAIGGFVLTPLGGLGPSEGATFEGFKRLIDALFLLGTLAFGTGALFALSGSCRSARSWGFALPRGRCSLWRWDCSSPARPPMLARVSDFKELLEGFFYRPDEDVGGMIELASADEHVVLERNDERAMDFLGFALEAESYAVPIETVREILRVTPLTEVPRSEPNLLGVFALRGEVIPVYDIKRKLKLADAYPQLAGPYADLSPLGKGARVLILSSEGGPAAVLVDSVEGVVRLMPSAVEPPPRGLATAEADGVVGLARAGAALYILLDLERTLG